MNFFKLAAAAAIVLSSFSLPAAPAAAQRGDRGEYRDDGPRRDARRDDNRRWRGDRGRHRGWRNNHRRGWGHRRVCRTVWRHHQRQRVCRTIRYRR